MSIMQYPEDETDLTDEQMVAVMADAEDVRLVTVPLYTLGVAAFTCGSNVSILRDATSLTMGITVTSQASRESAVVL